MGQKKKMKQLTEEQAIAFHDSGVFKQWDSEQIVRFQLFQKLLCVPFGVFHKAMEDVLGRPVYTHEFGSQGNLMEEYLGTKPAPTLEDIINMIPEGKRIVIGI